MRDVVEGSGVDAEDPCRAQERAPSRATWQPPPRPVRPSVHEVEARRAGRRAAPPADSEPASRRRSPRPARRRRRADAPSRDRVSAASGRAPELGAQDGRRVLDGPSRRPDADAGERAAHRDRRRSRRDDAAPRSVRSARRVGRSCGRPNMRTRRPAGGSRRHDGARRSGGPARASGRSAGDASWAGDVSTQEMSAHKKVIRIEENITLQTMAQKMTLKATELLMKLLSMGMSNVHINTTLDADTAKILAERVRLGGRGRRARARRRRSPRRAAKRRSGVGRRGRDSVKPS